MIRSTFALTLLLAASCAGAAVPTVGKPSPAAKAKSTFATTFYVMHWNQPHVLDYGYDAVKGELRLLVEHRGRDKTEQARLDLRPARDILSLANDWLAPAIEALRRGELECLRLDCEVGSGFVLQRGHRWRFWRKPLVRFDK